MTIHTTAKVIADTRHPIVSSARITTFEVYAPRFLLAEINTHRVLAKSAASSRAIPVKKRIEMVEDHGFIPEAFGKNKAGMQASDVVDDNEGAEDLWRMGIGYALGIAEALAKIDVHKQLANRVLEPYAYYHGVITGTEWENFFDLRLHPAAQPEFQDLAAKMKAAMDASEPITAHEHLPYFVGDDNLDLDNFTQREKLDICAARCARISYVTHDGKPFDLERDRQRVARLVNEKHMSPFDHAATADTVTLWKRSGRTFGDWDNPEDHRQFWGWIPDRVKIEKIAGMKPGRRSSFAAIPL